MAEPVATFWSSAATADLLGDYGVAADWMVTVPSRHLPAVSRCHERDSLKRDQQGDAAIFLGTTSPADVEAIEEARELGYHVLVIVDVNALYEDRSEVYISGLGVVRLPRAVVAAMRAYHRRAVQLADGVIVQTDALRRHYAPLGTPVHVIPQTIDPADWPALRKPRDGIFRVGFAAAPHVARRVDLELLQPALEWASAQPGVEVVLFGIDPLRHGHPDDGEDPLLSDDLAAGAYLPASFAAAVLRDARGLPMGWQPSKRERSARERKAKVEWMVNFEERAARWRFPAKRWGFISDAYRYRDALQWFDVGLAPSDPQHRDRSPTDTKLIDYAMAGAYPIASNCPPYDEWGELVRLVPGSAWGGQIRAVPPADAFLEAVQWAVAHRDEVRERALKAREYVLRERTIETTLPLWREAVAGRVAARL